MSGPLPSLALEMSMDGIALHQLAFDGHWHELARVGLADAALREKMANMREIAQRLEGRNFKVRVWLPADQIVRKTATITSDNEIERDTEARQVLEKITPHSGGEFAVAINKADPQGQTWVVGARHKTMHEAFAFAKSHGFKAVAYSTKNPVEGFVDKPYFKIPPNRARAIAIGTVGAILFGAIIAGGISFRIADPYLWWETPPKVADFAPFQNPDLTADKSPDNVLPSQIASPVFHEIAAVSTQSLREPLPYIPQRRLDATALENVREPAALYSEGFDVTYSAMAENARFSMPVNYTAITAADAADRPPTLGLYNVMSIFEDVAQPQLPTGIHEILLPTALASAPHGVTPVTVATISFVLEPVPSAAATMPYGLQLALSRNFGVSVDSLPRQTATVLAESQLVDVTRGLPELLPKLRSGREIPPQVAVTQIQPTVVIVETVPANPAEIAAAAQGFTIIEGAPSLPPVRRVVPPIEEAPVIAEIAPSIDQSDVENIEIAAPEFNLIDGRPDTLPVRRVSAPIEEIIVEAIATEEQIPEPPEIALEAVEVAIAPEPEAATEVPAESQSTDAAADTAQTIQPNIASANALFDDSLGTPPAIANEFTVVSGQPALLPLLRSGNEIPAPDSVQEPETALETDESTEAEPLDPAVAAANALRAKRRPQTIIEMEAPVDLMLSDAAPALANLPHHRGEGFDANAARIAEIASNRPRATAPVVPRDPQTVSLPPTASVARAATIEDGINLSKTSLIGIFGTADNREVLVRLASGRILQVSLGDRFSGWTIIAIGEDSIRIQKGNRTEILRMPN